MHSYYKLLVLAVIQLFAFYPADVLAAAKTPDEASLSVYAVRMTRSSPEFNKRFGSRYYGDGTPGVNLQLLLTLNDGAMLPIARDAVAIETFVDDTYHNLLSTGNDPTPYGGGGNNQTALSEDGKTLLFTVATSRVPSEEAGRVFVRGSVRARVSRGKPLLATNQLALMVGQDVMVGPFRTKVRALSDFGNGSMSLSLAIEGDASRIQKLQILDSNGNSLASERPGRFSGMDSAEGTVTTQVTLRSAPKEPVTVEYSYVEKTEQVLIPFEAQVDIGVTKAGPIKPFEGTSPKRAGAPRERAWPPPRNDVREEFQPRRAALDPDAGPKAGVAKSSDGKPGKAAVDLFSLTVSKPGPTEAKGVEWKSPPSPAFYPSGFTVARLMLSTPGASIVSVPLDGISLTRFEDNKGGRLDTTLYRDNSPAASPSTFPYVRRSPDGQQMLLNLSVASAPTPGATRCTLAGTIQAKIARGEKTNSTDKLEIVKGQPFKAGPFSGSIVDVRQSAPGTPMNSDGREIEVWVSLSGPIAKLRSIEFLDEKGATLIASRPNLGEGSSERAESTSMPFRLSSLPVGPLTLRVRHYESEETVQVPFDLSVGVGL